MEILIIIGVVVAIVIVVVAIMKMRNSKEEKFQRLPGSYPNSADLMTSQLPTGPYAWNADQWLRIGTAVDPTESKWNSADETLIIYQNIADPSLYLLRDDEMIYQFTFRSDEQVIKGGIINVDGEEYHVM